MLEFTRPITPCFGCDEDFISPPPFVEGPPTYSGTGTAGGGTDNVPELPELPVGGCLPNSILGDDSDCLLGDDGQALVED